MTSYKNPTARVCQCLFCKDSPEEEHNYIFTGLKLRKPLDFNVGSAANYYAGVVHCTVSHHSVFWETKDTEEAADFQSFGGSI